ncbi:MAG: DUF302 domain-containing protein [bacterium]
MYKIFITFQSFLLIVLFSAGLSFGANGMVNVKSAHSVTETANRLEAILKKKGLNVFARIDHAAGASKIGAELRPTELIVFGNPKVGTPLMQCQQSVAIDLPQKALIWQDESSQVWFSYNDPQYLADRHGIKGCDEVIRKIQNALSKLAAASCKAEDKEE